MKKTILKTLVWAMLLGSVNFATAKGGSSSLQVDVIKRKGNIVAVHLNKLATDVVKLKITRDNTGTTVYSKTEKSNDLTVTKYDMSQLPVGNYTVEVFTGKEKYVKKITIK